MARNARNHNNLKRQTRNTASYRASVDPGRYNTSSNAYAYEYEHTPEIKPERKQRRREKQGIKYIKSENPGAKVGIEVYAVMGVLFACAIVCILSVSNVKYQKINNSTLLSQLKDEQSRSADLAMEVSNTLDLEKIEEIARTKLNMSEPGAHQIMYINTSKQSYWVHYDTDYQQKNTAGTKESFLLSWFK